jgi:methyl-accepting chemotaxis protein
VTFTLVQRTENDGVMADSKESKMQWTIGKKLGGGFGALIIIMLVMAIVTVWQLNRLSVLEQFASHRSADALVVEEASSMGYQLYQVVADLIINRDLADFRSGWKELSEESDADFALVGKIVDTPEEREWLSESNEHYRELQHLVNDELYPLIESSAELGSEIRALDASIDEHVSEMNEHLMHIVEALGEESHEAAESFEKADKAAMLFSIILGLFGLIVGVLVAIVITRQITVPLKTITEGATLLATGDSELKGIDENEIMSINARSDELGEIGKAFSELIAYFQQKARIADNLAKGELDEDVEVASNEDVVGHALVGVRSSLQKMYGETEQLVKAAVDGRLNERGDEAAYSGRYADIIAGMNKVIGTLVGHLDSVPTPVMMIDNEFNIQYINPAGAKTGNRSADQLVNSKCYDHFKTGDCRTENCASHRAMQSGNTESRESVATPDGTPIDIAYSGVAVRGMNGEVIGALEVLSDQTEVKNAQRKTEKIAGYQSKEVVKLQDVLLKMSEGDLTVDYTAAEADDATAETRKSFVGIGDGLNATLDRLNELLGEVRVAVEQVSSGSSQVSSSSQTLSQGATEQASSLEEVSSSMTELGSQTSENSENAIQASQLSGVARDSATEGNSHMKDMLSAMEDINGKSTEVQKIIKVIDEIAFQTNLLALNAAVEAARAGVHGKGFAVVAEEVRNLAQRSAKAANETTELIEGNMSSVKNGADIANRTANSLEEIIGGITKVTDLVNEITAASKEQTVGVDEINSSLGQIDQITQSNAANAEETAAASEELSGQATNLQTMIARFKLKNGRASVSSQSHHVLDETHSVVEHRQHQKPNGNGHSAETLGAEELINLDDHDFAKF